jgi:PAS domain-containing protein
MSLPDMRTVVLGYAISNAICAIVIAFLWLQNRSRFAGLGFWVTDFVMQFAGISLIAMRGAIPDFLSIVVGNTLLIGGTLLLFIGLERFTGKIGSQIHNYLLLVVFTILQTYFAVVQPNQMARDINIGMGHLIICLQCIWLVVRRIESEVRSYTRQLWLVFAALSLVSVGYIAVNLIIPPGNNFLQSGVALTLSVMSYQMAYIGLTFGLLLLVNRRILVESINDITERKRAELNLHDLSARYEAILDTVPDIIAEVDVNKVYTWVN